MARNENGKGFSLKDELFNQRKIEQLAARFAAVYAAFDHKRFVKKIMAQLPSLELKERIGCIAQALEDELPEDFTAAATAIVEALPAPLDPEKSDNDFGDFIYAPLGEYIAQNGCSKKHLMTALATLREVTKRFSMEDAVRRFINAYPTETLHELATWTTDPHYHVRRLVSEGTRPRLPWSKRIGLTASDTIPLLDILYADPTRYVTRSVANHLNDITKEEPQLVVETLYRWQQEGKQEPAELAWITKHALRTLIKEGNHDALALLGYRQDPAIVLSKVAAATQVVPVGGDLIFSFSLTAMGEETLLVDYIIEFVKANGTHAPRTYKLKTLTLQPGDQVILTKKHRFVKDATTLTFYPGVHKLKLQINGKLYEGIEFELIVQ